MAGAAFWKLEQPSRWEGTDTLEAMLRPGSAGAFPARTVIPTGANMVRSLQGDEETVRSPAALAA